MTGSRQVAGGWLSLSFTYPVEPSRVNVSWGGSPAAVACFGAVCTGPALGGQLEVSVDAAAQGFGSCRSLAAGDDGYASLGELGFALVPASSAPCVVVEGTVTVLGQDSEAPRLIDAPNPVPSDARAEVARFSEAVRLLRGTGRAVRGECATDVGPVRCFCGGPNGLQLLADTRQAPAYVNATVVDGRGRSARVHLPLRVEAPVLSWVRLTAPVFEGDAVEFQLGANSSNASTAEARVTVAWCGHDAVCGTRDDEVVGNATNLSAVGAQKLWVLAALRAGNRYVVWAEPGAVRVGGVAAPRLWEELDVEAELIRTCSGRPLMAVLPESLGGVQSGDDLVRPLLVDSPTVEATATVQLHFPRHVKFLSGGQLWLRHRASRGSRRGRGRGW